MKTNDIIKYSLIFLASVLLTAQIVVQQLTGNDLLGRRENQTPNSQFVKCTNQPAVARPTTDDPQLKVVAEYEQVCQSSFINDMMLFTGMPISDDNAISMADQMTTRLKKFDAFGIRPIVIAEPDSEWGLIDFYEYGTGYYDVWVDTYFKHLKENGITDKQIGIWVPFPEPQQPTWNNNTDPDDFAHSVNRHLKTFKRYFPGAQSAILLDSQVGEEDRSSQVLAYVRLVDPSVVDIVGLQGFPWHPSGEGDEREPVVSASKFVPAEIVKDLAKSLDTKDVMINTGSYRHRTTETGGETAISTEQRKVILDSIVHETEILTKANYNVTLNVFAENKLEANEGVNWSYWQPGSFDDTTHAPLFTQFIKGLHDKEVIISLFDSRK